MAEVARGVAPVRVADVPDRGAAARLVEYVVHVFVLERPVGICGMQGMSETDRRDRTGNYCR